MARTRAGYVALKGSERRLGAKAKLLGPADPKEQMSVSVVLRRRPDGAPIPPPDYFAKTPPKERPRLTEAEFAAKYGASPADLSALAKFAKSNGLTVVESNAARRNVVLSGTVAQMQHAFDVTLGRYQVPAAHTRRGPASTAPASPQTEIHRGREGMISVSREVAAAIIGVFGLDNRRVTRRNTAEDPGTTSSLTVPAVANLYNFPTNAAKGQTIAIVSSGAPGNGYDRRPGPVNDFARYFSSLSGYAMPTILTVPAAADAYNDTPDNETTQDICIASTVAQGATIAVYFLSYFAPGQNGWHDLIQRVVTPSAGDFPAGVSPPSVLSCSCYLTDGDDLATLSNEGVTTAFIDALHLAFQDAALQGVTVCTAAGDQGADSQVGSTTAITQFGHKFAADGKAHVQYPATDPYVLSCGGTTIGNVESGSFQEYVWNDSNPAFNVPNWATGGGVSDYFTATSGHAPSYAYQQDAGVPGSLNDGHAGRGVPDIAGNASGNSGYAFYYNGTAWVMNGTSAAAPLYAGLIAVLNAALGENVGYLNPLLYQLGKRVCRQILAPPGPADNGLNGIRGYPAGSGWNACTGLGVLDGNALLSELRTHFGELRVNGETDTVRKIVR